MSSLTIDFPSSHQLTKVHEQTAVGELSYKNFEFFIGRLSDFFLGLPLLQALLTFELEKASQKVNLRTLVKLSQRRYSPLIASQLQHTLSSFIQKLQEAHPSEPLQLHLGGRPYSRLSALFLQAFATQLRDMPIRILHIHGSCPNDQVMKHFLSCLKECPTLYHLHFDLDAKGSKKAFEILEETLSSCKALEYLVFQSEEETPFSWQRLALLLSSHQKLRSLSFYGPISIPKDFHVEGYEIFHPPFSTGFCIKKTERLK